MFLQNNEASSVLLIKESIDRLSQAIEANNYSTYDHYDFWTSKFGIFAKKLYRKNKMLGLPFVGVIYSLDMFLPQSRKFFATKNISAEAMSYFALGYFRLYEIEHQDIHLEKAMDCLEWLARNYSRTQSGLGWGLHFDWQTPLTFIPRGTSCVTITSYSTDVFLKGYKITKKQAYLDIAIKTAEFALSDLNRKVFDENTIAVSYTPICESFVVNANSYCAKILYDVSCVTSEDRYVQFADKVVNYILKEQNDDGSWFYYGKDQLKRNFIDNLHTCFVLENLHSMYLVNKRGDILESIKKGYSFFIKSFINPDYSCKHFYIYPEPTGVRVDIRSCAETIYCCTLLSTLFFEALDIAKKVAMWTIENMQDPKGYFYFRIYKTHKHRMPYMRWGQAPMFNALTYLYKIFIQEEL